MVFVLKPGVDREKIDKFIKRLESEGFSTILSVGTERTVVCLIGNTARVDVDFVVRTNDIVEYGKRVTEPYKAVNRAVHPDNTYIGVAGLTLGEGFFHVIAGPCSVESERQIIAVAQAVKESGGAMLRGGAFKPRTSPYAFRGLHEEGIRLLLLAKRETGLPIVTEIMSQTQLELFEQVDVVQIGARNMQRAVGESHRPCILKRGLAATITEWLQAADYILSAGNPNVILCERGIRTYETSTRFTLDISSVAVIKRDTHLPVIVDPSHAAGHFQLVPTLARAAVAAGADGLLVEVHPDPVNALSDGLQSLTFSDFAALMRELKAIARAIGREI